MKKQMKGLILLALIPIIASCNKFGGGTGGNTGGGSGDSEYTGEVKTITVDGGGDISNFNTTASMTQSASNPYPYNTLETLCNTWSKAHPQYKVVINKTSSNGDRTVLVPQLNNHTAPDITYQNGTVINTDLGKDYYVKLTDYLQTPNEYVEGNEHWIDIYQKEEISQNLASDGNYYNVNLEKIPVGIMYNKTMLKKVGITTTPTTFGDFINDCKAVKAYASSATSDDEKKYTAYSTTDNWYAIALESNMFSDILDDADVLRKNGIVDQEELVRAYVKGYWQPSKNALGDGATLEGNRYYDYIKKCAELGSVQAPLSYSAHEGFVNGQLAFLQVTGKEIRKLSGNSAMTFDWGVMPFPSLSKVDYPDAAAPSLRGVAGLATCWFVTKSAEDKGTVDGCIDLLKYLTAPTQNNKLIGDLKGGIPLNPDSDYKMPDALVELAADYNEDKELVSSGKTCYWAAVNSWGVLGYSYYTKFVKTLQDIQNGLSTVEVATKSLAKTIDQTVAALRIENEYDETKW
jgi:raffinose/stachyose/melibiose transport system substrate-binding protein